MLRVLALGVILGLVGTAHAETDQDRSARMFQRGRVLANQGSYEDACKLFEKSYELDPALGTLLNLADCKEHLGQLADARDLFAFAVHEAARLQDSKRQQFAHERVERIERQLAAPTETTLDAFPAVPASPHATHSRSKAWLGVFIGSTTVGLAGAGLFFVGHSRLHEAQRELCRGGAYSGPQFPPTVDGIECNREPSTATLTPDDVNRLNDQGNHASAMTRIGFLTGTVGAGLAVASAYMYFVRRSPRDHERASMIVPTVTPDYAGASLSTRW